MHDHASRCVPGWGYGPNMTSQHRLPGADYIAFLDSESARFVSLLADADPAARVPSCPDWDAADLLWHLTEVQWFWGSIVGRALSDPQAAQDDKPDRPDDYPALLDLQRRATERLLAAVSAGDDSDPMWTWFDEDQTRGFIRRRQAHEALIHRLDAEQVVGDVTPLDARLATDGIDEALRIMFGGTPDWAEFRWEAGPVVVVAQDSRRPLVRRDRPGRRPAGERRGRRRAVARGARGAHR